MNLTKEQILAERSLKKTAQILSDVFHPVSIPLVSFILLFFCTYLNNLPMTYRLMVLSFVAAFTILIPTLSIWLYRHLSKLKRRQMSMRENRYIPILMVLLAYVCCFILMRRMMMPWYMTGIILAALLMLIISLIVNLRWKLSEHMMGVGAVIGGIICFSMLFGYNPIWWLSLFILLAGWLGSARIILGHHTQGEVYGGFFLGFICAMVVLNPFLNIPFRFFLI